ncbi:unnamed protein product, partial [Effrenium voratum]
RRSEKPRHGQRAAERRDEARHRSREREERRHSARPRHEAPARRERDKEGLRGSQRLRSRSRRNGREREGRRESKGVDLDVLGGVWQDPPVQKEEPVMEVLEVQAALDPSIPPLFGAMRFSVSLAIGALGAWALPGDEEILEQLHAHKQGLLEEGCRAPECSKPVRKFERIATTQPGFQWDDAGGYCGSWSIQRAAMAKGAWISQQQVRNHTVPGGGHDEEILATNIDVAFKNLKIKAEGFDYKNTPTPQVDAYRRWIKKQLVNGHALVWMIMLNGAHYPVYPGLPFGLYSHVEPVVGILSDHPLTDENFYDDDVVVHYTDADANTYYRTMASLPGSYVLFAHCPGSDYVGYPCINQQRGFGWAIQGFLDDEKALPLALTIDKWQSEPDVRSGEAPAQLTGTLTLSELTVGKKYVIFRWDGADDAFKPSAARVVLRFTASSATASFTDKTPFPSDGATYYRCREDKGESLSLVV